MYLRIFGSFKSAKNNWVRKSQIRKSQIRKSQIRKSQKIYGPHMANPQIATFAKATQIPKNCVFKYADLRYVELTSGPPTIEN